MTSKNKLFQKQEQAVWRWLNKDVLKRWNEVTELIEQGSLFQSDRALYLNAQRPISLLIFGDTEKKTKTTASQYARGYARTWIELGIVLGGEDNLGNNIWK